MDVRGDGRLQDAVARALETAGFELGRGGRVVAFEDVPDAGALVVDLDGSAGRPGQCVLRPGAVAMRGSYPEPWRWLFETLLTGRPLRLGMRARCDVVHRDDLVGATVHAVAEGVVGAWCVGSAGRVGELDLGRALRVETGSSSVVLPALRARLPAAPELARLPGFSPRHDALAAARHWVEQYQRDRSDLARR